VLGVVAAAGLVARLAVVAGEPTTTDICPQAEVASVIIRAAPMTAIPLQRSELARLIIL